MTQWHHVEPGKPESTAEGNQQRANNTNDAFVSPPKPEVPESASSENKQTQTQSQQQPPVIQEQATSDQPQVRGGTYVPPKEEDIPIPAAAQIGPLTEAQFVPMPTGGIRALAIQLWPDDRNNPDAFNQHVADLLMMNRDMVRDEYAHPVNAWVRIK